MSAPEKGGLCLCDFATRRCSVTLLADKRDLNIGAPGLGISPGGRNLLIGFTGQPRVYVMLVENYSM
ncbi:MAG TPA: hypothetical protein VL128_16830 [Candidatus Eisenbacteria bacterium]|nr:hypothetical protein [Candidatus Eisenbacteria bacterium]